MPRRNNPYAHVRDLFDPNALAQQSLFATVEPTAPIVCFAGDGELAWSNSRFHPVAEEPESPPTPEPTPWPADREGEARYIVELMPRRFSEPMPFAKALALHRNGPMFAVVQIETGEWEGGERDTEGPNATGAWDGGEQLIRVDRFAWEDQGDGEWGWSCDAVESETLLESEL